MFYALGEFLSDKLKEIGIVHVFLLNESGIENLYDKVGIYHKDNEKGC